VSAETSRADAGILFAFIDYDQFDESDFGLGADFSYRFTDWLAADAQLSYFPSELGEPASFSGSRLMGLIGVRLGHRFGGVGVYGAVRPGFASFSEAREPRACILIYPPPLACTLGGSTVFALDLGAGLELTPGDRLVIRGEVGDLLLKYPGPGFDKDREVFEDSLWSHNLRVTASVGLRF
jgi:hypothetical protein